MFCRDPLQNVFLHGTKFENLFSRKILLNIFENLFKLWKLFEIILMV